MKPGAQQVEAASTAQRVPDAVQVPTLAVSQVVPCQGELQKQVVALHPAKLWPPLLRPEQAGPAV